MSVKKTKKLKKDLEKPKKKPKKKVVRARKKPGKKDVEKKKDTTPSKEVQKQISDAVDRLPQLMEQHVRPMPPPPSQPTPPRPSPKLSPARDEKGKYIWLFSGVVIVVISILVMWVWNIRTLVYDATVAKQNGDSSLFGKAKDDFGELLSVIQSDQNNDFTRALDAVEEEQGYQEELKNALGALITNARENTTTTTSSTPVTTPTTTPTSTDQE